MNNRPTPFTRQATILRKNLIDWDIRLRTPQRGEDWPTMLGRLNAASNQTHNLDKTIEDVLEHFVFLPKKSTANPQDIPFFLSTRLENTDTSSAQQQQQQQPFPQLPDPVAKLANYEKQGAQLASEYEEGMVRF